MSGKVDGKDAPGWRDLGMAAGFAFFAFLLFTWRLSDPARLNFDETHYVPPARALIALSTRLNPEHPPLGKLLIGTGIALFGDNPFGWRIMSALFGAILVFAGVMAARWLFRSRPAAIMTGTLLLFSQTLFVQARIAMLDIFMGTFLMLAFWMFAATARQNFRDTRRLVLAGLFLGLATACKWTAVPLVAAALIAFALLQRRIDPARRPMPLFQGVLWLGPFAILVYLLSFTPLMLLREGAVPLQGIIPYQLEMLRLQTMPLTPHPYQSQWWQWVLDLRPVWYFYEPVDGIQRGVLLIGNPAICWGGLAALLLCLYAGVREAAPTLLVPPLLYLAALSFFILIPKDVQFYYHYFVPSLLLCFAIAGALDHHGWQRGHRLAPWLCIGLAGLVFLDFYPILSAAPLSGPQAFTRWMWLESWR